MVTARAGGIRPAGAEQRSDPRVAGPDAIDANHSWMLTDVPPFENPGAGITAGQN
jgi:hypothetical protein